MDEDCEDQKALSVKRDPSVKDKKPEPLVTNPILETEPGHSKRRSNNRVLEEVHTGLMSKFHQEREDGTGYYASNPILKHSHVAKPRKNKGGR